MFSLTHLVRDGKGNYGPKYLFPTQASFPNTTYTEPSCLAVDQDGGLVAGGWARRLMSNGKQQTVFALCRFLASGTLDKKFGKNGTLLYEFSKGQNAMMTAMAIDSDNNIIAVGFALVDKLQRVAIAKFDASTGKSITGFGNGGNVIYKSFLGGEYGIERARDIAIDHNNNGFYVTGNGTNNIVYFPFIVHFLSTGKIDSAFNNGSPISGYVPSSCQWAQNRHPIALDYIEGALWGIVAGGAIRMKGGTPYLYLGRYTKNGDPDYNFAHEGECGVNGWKFYDQWSIPFLDTIAVDAECGYVCAATAYKNDAGQFFLMRCNTDEYGSDLDLSFGAGGVVFTTFPNAKAQDVYDMIIDSEGNIITAGIANVNAKNHVALAFYDQNGTPLKAIGDNNGCLLVDYGVPLHKTTRVSAIAEYKEGCLAVLTDGECSKVGSKMYTPKDVFLTAFIAWVIAVAFISLP